MDSSLCVSAKSYQLGVSATAALDFSQLSTIIQYAALSSVSKGVCVCVCVNMISDMDYLYKEAWPQSSAASSLIKQPRCGSLR